MRTSDLVLTMSLCGLAFGFTPAVSFDGTRTPEGATVSAPAPAPGGETSLGRATPLAAVPNAPFGVTPKSAINPQELVRSGTQALRDGNVDKAIAEFETAARQGSAFATWRLGRMYADGEGVIKDKARAFEYFRQLTGHPQADDSVGTPQAGFVANAFVSLGQYYLDGIPNVISPDPATAYQMFRYAASYFADSEAQYRLGQLYLNGRGIPRDGIQAARWLRLAANKGDHRAQALLGSMLFKGQDVARQPALGLFWLIVAKDGATAEESWITDTYGTAFAQATDEERALAYKYLENWVKTRR